MIIRGRPGNSSRPCAGTKGTILWGSIEKQQVPRCCGVQLAYDKYFVGLPCIWPTLEEVREDCEISQPRDFVNYYLTSTGKQVKSGGSCTNAWLTTPRGRLVAPFAGGLPHCYGPHQHRCAHLRAGDSLRCIFDRQSICWKYFMNSRFQDEEVICLFVVLFLWKKYFVKHVAIVCESILDSYK